MCYKHNEGGLKKMSDITYKEKFEYLKTELEKYVIMMYRTNKDALMNGQKHLHLMSVKE